MNCGYLVLIVLVALHGGLTQTIQSATLYPHNPVDTQHILNSTTLGEQINNGTIFVSKPVTFRSTVPFGSRLYNTAYILTNGIVYFTDDKHVQVPGSPDLDFASSQHQNILAPFWADILPNEGQVSYSVYESCGDNNQQGTSSAQHVSATRDAVFARARQDVIKYHAAQPDFAVDAVLVVTWSHVTPFSNFSRTGRPEQNTFQSVLITGWTKNAQGILSDEKTSYALYLYKQGEMTWNYVQGRVINIGFAAGSDVAHLPNANTPYVTMLANSTGNTGDVGISSFLVGRVNSQSERCQQYLCKYGHLPSNETFQNESQKLPLCPCSMDRLGVEWERYHRPGEKLDIQCYIISPVAKTKVLKGNTLNKLCCYKVFANQPSQQDPKSFGYIIGAPDSGHVLASDPWVGTGGSDSIAAHDTCCEGASQSMCARFYDIFQDNGCSSQHGFANAFGFGDPHIITFDGLAYSMNGWGEFTLMRIDTEKFYLQARTERPPTSDGKQASATIFKAFAAREEGYGHFQVELSQNERSMLVYISGANMTQDFYSDANFISSNGSISVSRESKENKDFVTAKFPCGVSVSVNVGLKNLEIEVIASERLNRKTIGLLGFYSGNTTDDFKLSDGTSTTINSPEQIIYSFIKEWAVTPANSVFHYATGDSADKHRNPSFYPMYSNAISGSHADMSFCQSDRLCMFDYVATGSKEFAEHTRDLDRRLLGVKKNFENHPPSLQVSGLDTKGFWVINDGQQATLSVQTNDLDNLPVRLELMEDTTRNSVTLRGSEVVYTPDLKKPVILGLKAVDNLNASSALTYVKIGICPGCNGHGKCTTDETGDLDYINGHFWILKCLCQTPYTGMNCETLQDACDLRPCSVGQNCSSLHHPNSLDYSCGPCPHGYEYMNGKCVDLDECSQNPNVCGGHSCVNTLGSYTCECSSGFEYSQGSKSCVDINECSHRPSVCQQSCQNIPGGYKCSCLTGYTLNKDNSCQLDSQHAASCSHCQQLCRINGNLTNCTCYQGYEVDPAHPATCKDFDECAAGNHICSQVCVNQNGYYQCSCNDGFLLSADNRSCEACPFPTFGKGCSMRCDCHGRGTCDPVKGCVCDKNWHGPSCSTDVNECSRPDACQSEQICHNTVGSYTCSCPAGSNLVGGNCTDCQDNYYGESCSSRCNCLAHQKCDKVNGACSCVAGWMGTTCDRDIDECITGANHCNTSAHEECINTPGGFYCTCATGFGLVDINGAKLCKECSDWKFGLNCSQSCNCLQSNTQDCAKSSGKCLCKPGWTGARCESDIDECVEHTDNCATSNHEMCINTLQSFSCGCQLGYELDTDGKTCKECGDSKFGLKCGYYCTCVSPNTQHCDKASGKCVCKPGWTGVNCESDLDECTEPTSNCSTSNHEVCNNTPGSFDCVCQEGFIHDTDGKTCKECGDWRFGLNCGQTCSCLTSNSLNCDKSSGKCNCQPGWTGLNCETDIDECADHTSNCSRSNHEECMNTPGYFHCVCQKGFIHDTDGKTCKECGDWKYGLNCGQACTCLQNNTLKCDKSSGKCNCQPGWTGVNCETDVDECADHTHNCSMPNHEACNNTPGHFQCVCRQGFILDTNGKTCKDVDLCSKSNCTGHCIEVNQNSSIQCLCAAGYHLMDDQMTCEECPNNTAANNCSLACDCVFQNTARCINGTCECAVGWTGEKCQEDIDECAVKRTDCDISQHKVCTNTPGSFNCSCEAGYEWQASSCTGIVVSTQPIPLSVSTQPIPLSVSSQSIPLSVSTQPIPLSVSTQPIPLSVSTQPIPLSVSTQPIPLSVSTQPIPLPVVKVNLTFEYAGEKLDLVNDGDKIKADIKSQFLGKLQAKHSAVVDLIVTELRHGSLIAATDVVLKDDSTTSLDHLAQALYQVEKANEAIDINGRPVTFTEVTIKNLKVDKSSSPCLLKTNFDPCKDSESCQEQGIEATCVLISKKDNANFIIGMSVGLFSFVVLCAVIAALVSLWARKKKAGKDLKHGGNLEISNKRSEKNGSLEKDKSSNFYSSIQKPKTKNGDQSIPDARHAEDAKVSRQLSANERRDSLWQGNGKQNTSAVPDRRDSLWQGNGNQNTSAVGNQNTSAVTERRTSLWQGNGNQNTSAVGNQNTSAVADRRTSLWQGSGNQNISAVGNQNTSAVADRRTSLWQGNGNQNTSAVPDRRASMWQADDNRRQSAIAVPDRRASVWQAEENRKASAVPDRRASMWQAEEDRRQSVIAVPDRRASVWKTEENGSTSAVSDRRASMWPAADENRRQSTYPVPDRRASMWPADENRRQSTYPVPDRRASAWSTNEDRRLSSSQALPPGSPAHKGREFNNRAYDAADSSWQSEVNARNRLDSLVGTPTDWDNNFQLAGNAPAQSGNVAKKGDSKDVNRRFSRDPFLLY